MIYSEFKEVQRKMIYDKIEELAEEVRKIYEISAPVNNINSVVKNLGGRILEGGISEPERMGLFKTGDETFEIHISTYQQEPYKRFLVAQYLGHLFLHMGFQTNDKIWNECGMHKKFVDDDTEKAYEAEYFALCFLMPKREFEKEVDKNTRQHETLSKFYVVDTGAVAKHFGVSISMAVIRGNRLGLLVV